MMLLCDTVANLAVCFNLKKIRKAFLSPRFGFFSVFYFDRVSRILVLLICERSSNYSSSPTQPILLVEISI